MQPSTSGYCESKAGSYIGVTVPRDFACIGVLFILTALNWYPRRHGPLDLRWDSSVYYVLGTSLAQGSGYRLLSEPGEITSPQYPPLVPALVALHQLALRTSDPFSVGTALKLSWFLCSVLYYAAIYFVLKRFLPWPWALYVAALCVFNLPIYLHFNQSSSGAAVQSCDRRIHARISSWARLHA